VSDVVDRARKLQPLVRRYADQAEVERRLPAEVAEAMAREGLYRLAAPRVYGGAEAPPRTQIEVIEALSLADGSAGWNLMIGIETFGLVAPGFSPDEDFLSDPGAILCSSTAAVGRAEEAEGGVRLTGRWPFVSGCHNARVFGGLCQLHRGGEPVEGRPPVFALVDRGQFEIEDTWKVGGLRGSGSHDVHVDDVFVPGARLGATLGGVYTRRNTCGDSPLFRIPLGSRLAYNKVGVGFGIARAALDAFTELAVGKVPRFTGTTLRERPFAQRAIARAEVRLRSARAFVFERVDALWEALLAGRGVTDKERALLQIACSDAAAASVEAVDLVAEAAGTTANDLGFALERQQRDVRVVRQHFTVAPHHLEDGGRVLLGMEPRSPMLALLR
jgi:alkylation response protein AidB-like acyl-CoA dehydrogenase